MSVDVNKTQPEAEDLSRQEASANQENPPVAEVEPKDEDISFEKLLEAYEGRTQRFSEGEVIRERLSRSPAAESLSMWDLSQKALSP